MCLRGKADKQMILHQIGSATCLPFIIYPSGFEEPNFLKQTQLMLGNDMKKLEYVCKLCIT